MGADPHEMAQFLRYLLACSEHDRPFDLKGHVPRINRILGQVGCACGQQRIPVTDSKPGFYDRHGCCRCNVWDGPPVLDGTPTCPKVPGLVGKVLTICDKWDAEAEAIDHEGLTFPQVVIY